jgi:hypothetical protein
VVPHGHVAIKLSGLDHLGDPECILCDRVFADFACCPPALGIFDYEGFRCHLDEVFKAA